MVHAPILTEADVRSFVDHKIFQRGQTYYRSKYLHNLQRQENKIWGKCSGNELYHLSLVLEDHEVIAADCSCPYDWGGFCKHQVAMLLAYVHEPNTFQAIAPLSELLADYHRDDLVKLIDRFLEQEPQLLDLLLTQSKTASQKDATIETGELFVNGKAIAQSVRASLESAYEYDSDIARELRQFERQGEQYLNQGDYLNAGAIYEALLDAFDSAYDMDFDHEGELAELVTNYVENLGECLLLGGSSLDPVYRRKWYEQLLQVFFKDLDLGGIGYGENVDKYLTSATDDDEWDEIKDACLKLLEYTANSWTQERIIRLLSDRLSPQESIKLIQAKGSPEQRIAVYLDLGEYQQAQQIALKQYSYELMPILKLADALVEAQQSLLALDLVTQKYQTSPNNRHSVFYLRWLAKYHQDQQRQTAIAYIKEALFLSQEIEDYRQLRRLMQTQDNWEEMRHSVLQQLAADQETTLLIEIAIDERDLDRAMQLFTQFKITNYGVVTAEKLAKQIIILAKSLRRFEVAIAVNQDLMEQEIRQKNRKHYAIAARYLKDIKQCYLELNHLQDWQHYQAEFKQKYMKLRALMDECRYSLQT